MAKTIRLTVPSDNKYGCIDAPKGNLKCKEEDWSISANTKEDNGTERELAQIYIHFPDGVRWIGSIQDLRSIEHYSQNIFAWMKNAQNALIAAGSAIVNPEMVDAVNMEAEQLLSHFKK